MWGNDPHAVFDSQALASLRTAGCPADRACARPTQLHYEPPREGSLVEGADHTEVGDVIVIHNRRRLPVNAGEPIYINLPRESCRILDEVTDGTKRGVE